tara:strand:+ start:5776 stop:5991 length:216 start_codon:yes stop_codon:yes gene_type:complete
VQTKTDPLPPRYPQYTCGTTQKYFGIFQKGVLVMPHLYDLNPNLKKKKDKPKEDVSKKRGRPKKSEKGKAK